MPRHNLFCLLEVTLAKGAEEGEERLDRLPLLFCLLDILVSLTPFGLDWDR
jgi:hypothetical protein